MQIDNFAAWIPAEKEQLKVGPAPFPTCGENDLVIRNHVVAINPIDWKIQTFAGFGVQYPAILGQDVAGEIIQVGSKLEDKWSIGQRVMAHTIWSFHGPAYGAFQLFPTIKPATTALIPDNITFSQAAVLPLSISTAAAGLFMKATLGLHYPETESSATIAPAAATKPTLLLWGGSSSVGSSVIQLASASGYTVITTASPSNVEYCKKLGAVAVLDYHDTDIVSKLIGLLKGTTVAGAYDAIGSDNTVRQCVAVLDATGGGRIASVGIVPEDQFKKVKVTRIQANSIVSQEPEVADRIWGNYVARALETGKLVTSPRATVVGSGLDDVQTGINKLKQGVSARKIEVILG